MSMQTPLIGVSSRYVTRLGLLPDYEEMLNLLSSQSSDAIHIFLNHYFHISSTKLEDILHNLNQYAHNQVSEILHLLPHNSAPFIYLQLQKDFETVKTIILNHSAYGEALGEKSFSQILTKLQGNIYYLTDFKGGLLQKKDKLIHTEDNFELISYLEEIFLTILFRYTEHSNVIIKKFVLAKINTYTLLNVLSRTQKGQARDHIIRHLLPIRGSLAINAVRTTFSFGDILGDIGQFLDLTPADISIINIENTLLQQEIKTINGAQFSGMAEERILQYTERLYHIINNTKLIVLREAGHIDREQAPLRFINHSAL